MEGLPLDGVIMSDGEAAVHKLKKDQKRILKKRSAYAIMPVGKKVVIKSIRTKNGSLNRTAIQLRDPSFLFRRLTPHQAICCPYGRHLTICRCSGKLHQPQQRLKRRSSLPSKHLLPLPGIGRTTWRSYHMFWQCSTFL